MDNIGYASNPQDVLEQHFDSVYEREMKGLKLCHKDVKVQAVGFHLYENHWLGMMITPWFLNLMILPQTDQPWPELKQERGNDILLEFPCGNLKFTPRIDPDLGSYLCCSLASPLRNIKSHDDLVSVAHKVLTDLQRIPMKSVEEPVSLSKRSLFTKLAAG